MPIVFISYVREDKNEVLQFARELNDVTGINVWIDLNNIEIGDVFDREIEDAILRCDYYVPIFSNKFIEKYAAIGEFFMLKELRFAKKVWETKPASQKWVLPVRLEPCVLPDAEETNWLQNINSVNLFENRKNEFFKFVSTIKEEEVTEKSKAELSNLDLYAAHDHEMNFLEKSLKEFLYFHPGGYVRAINLFGANNDFITEENMEVHYDAEQKFTPPDALVKAGQANIDKQKSTGRKVFNGPTARLVSLKHDCLDGDQAGIEKSRLSISLAPINWFDYLMTNDVVRDDYIQALDHLEPFDLLQGDISRIRLSNIAETLGAIVSNDGYVAYQMRQNQAVGSDLYSGSVAENINRYYDEVDPSALQSACRSSRKEEDYHLSILRDVSAHGFNANVQRENIVDGNYRLKSGNIPHPFITIRRGILEELSPDLLRHIKPYGIKLVGVSFDLVVFHPNFLFSIFVDLSANEIVNKILINPGKDFREGRIRFVKADFEDEGTKKVLNQKNWAPSGKASLVRTITFINAIKQQYRKDFPELFSVLETIY